MEMRYIDGLKSSAIGQALEMTSNAVWVILHRGREAVSMCVKKQLAAAGTFP